LPLLSPVPGDFPLEIEVANQRARYPDRVLGVMGKSLRTAAGVAVAVALILGTFWGDDDHFPFGPFRMYSVANRLDGTIKAVHLVGVTSSGETIAVGFDEVGLRRAEIEGQLRFMTAERLAPYLAAAYHERNNTRLEELHLVLRLTRLEDGRPVASEDTMLGVWKAS
jgi:hypothetical protein